MFRSRSALAWFASNIIFYLRKYIWDYEMPCNYIPKLFQKPKVVLKFEWKHLSLYLLEEQLMYLRIFGILNTQKLIGFANPQIDKNIWSANRKSANCHNCGRSTNLNKNFSTQSCGFAICGTYLRAAHLCSGYKYTGTKLQRNLLYGHQIFVNPEDFSTL